MRGRHSYYFKLSTTSMKWSDLNLNDLNGASQKDSATPS